MKILKIIFSIISAPFIAAGAILVCIFMGMILAGFFLVTTSIVIGVLFGVAWILGQLLALVL